MRHVGLLPYKLVQGLAILDFHQSLQINVNGRFGEKHRGEKRKMNTNNRKIEHKREEGGKLYEAGNKAAGSSIILRTVGMAGDTPESLGEPSLMGARAYCCVVCAFLRVRYVLKEDAMRKDDAAHGIKAGEVSTTSSGART